MPEPAIHRSPYDAGDTGGPVHVRAIRRAVCREMLFAPRGWETVAAWTDDPDAATCTACLRAMRPGLV